MVGVTVVAARELDDRVASGGAAGEAVVATASTTSGYA